MDIGFEVGVGNIELLFEVAPTMYTGEWIIELVLLLKLRYFARRPVVWVECMDCSQSRKDEGPVRRGVDDIPDVYIHPQSI